MLGFELIEDIGSKLNRMGESNNGYNRLRLGAIQRDGDVGALGAQPIGAQLNGFGASEDQFAPWPLLTATASESPSLQAASMSTYSDWGRGGQVSSSSSTRARSGSIARASK